MSVSVIGVALRANPYSESSIVCLEWNNGGKPRISWLDVFSTDEGLLSTVKACRPQVVTIGSPSFLPRGLDCLEPECQCAPVPMHVRGRAAERELGKKGVRIFYTVKGSETTPLIYRAIKVCGKLRALGVEVIEASPPATKVLLFGDRLPKKRGRTGSKEQLRFLQRALGELIEGLVPSNYSRLNESMCDALLNAYIAWLYAKNQAHSVGNPDEGLIMVPSGIIQAP